jgi:hypothetical protein
LARDSATITALAAAGANLEAKAGKKEFEGTALVLFTRQGQTALVEALLKAGANVRAPSPGTAPAVGAA